MKRCAVLILTMIILLNSFAYAMPIQKKNETVYVNLGKYGNVEEINIYSKCLLNGNDNITDYTKYNEVTNLSNRDKYNTIEDGIEWDVSGDKSFSYTGKVGEEYYNLIPWNFEISYKLNGADVNYEDLLGASGLVEINIEINANENANEYYKNNYFLEITGSYDMSKYLSLSSDDAMITNTGNTETLMFVVLPGQSTSLNVEIGTDDFEMDGITMAMVPLTGDMLDKVVELIDDRNDMKDAINSMNSSADVVLDSLYGMGTGLNGITEGVKEIKNGINEVHGIDPLRDQDIEKLKSILTELTPIVQNIQTDVNNLRSGFDSVVDLASELKVEVDNMTKNLKELSVDLKTLEDLSKDLPDDVEEIKKLLKDTSYMVSDLSSLIDSLSSSNSASTEELKTKLVEIGTATQQIGETVELTVPKVSGDVTAFFALISIGDSAKKIGENVNAVQEILTKMSSSMPNTGDTSEDLEDLSSQLKKVANLLNGEDAEIFEDVIKDIRIVSNELENMLNTANKYNNEFLENKDDFYVAIDNASQLVNELNEMSVLSISMVSNIQTMLNSLSGDIYTGSDKTTDALLDVNNQLIQITKQSNSLKDSKNEVKDILDNRLDEVEDETTIFNVDGDAKVVSFGSSKNENVDKVEFLLKTPDIKKVKVKNDDMEVEKDTLTFWDRLRIIFDKLFGWIFK